jgi:biopolymer transport protein ExbB
MLVLEAIQKLVEQGGVLIAALMGLSLVLWTLIAERYWFVYWQFPRLKQHCVNAWQALPPLDAWSISSLKNLYLSQADAQLQQNQSTIRNLIALCPLMGLLGTVTGMISVFDTIAMTGNSDAKAMAAGIYQATLPTMAGLLLALSALYFSHQLTRKAQQLSQDLSKHLSRAET